MVEYHLYTDGGCVPNPGKGAWAYILRWGDQEITASGYEEETTNSRMEITAALMGIDKFLEVANPETSRLIIFSDSTYVVNGISKWCSQWKKRGWKKVMNVDLWELV